MVTENANDRKEIRLALPSKGRMEEETLHFLDACGISVARVNPRQYIAHVSSLPGLEVWFQRSADVVRKVRDGDVDLGIAGLDTVAEHNTADNAIVVLHEALDYGHCALTLATPEAWGHVNSVQELAQHAAQARRPLRIVTKHERLVSRFLDDHGVRPYRIVHADGALEAAPQMGSADLIADLVSSGVTLRENRLKELANGRLLESQAVFIGNRTALETRPDVLEMAHQMLELIEAHLRADQNYYVVANMRGRAPEEVAAKVFAQPDLGGLQGPTISRVYRRDTDDDGWYAISLVMSKRRLQGAIRQLRAIGGSGVVVTPVTYIFEEEPPRWRALLETLNLTH